MDKTFFGMTKAEFIADQKENGSFIWKSDGCELECELVNDNEVVITNHTTEEDFTSHSIDELFEMYGEEPMDVKEYVKTLSDDCLDYILRSEYNQLVWGGLASYRDDERPFKVCWREWAEEEITRDFTTNELKKLDYDY